MISDVIVSGPSVAEANRSVRAQEAEQSGLAYSEVVNAKRKSDSSAPDTHRQDEKRVSDTNELTREHNEFESDVASQNANVTEPKAHSKSTPGKSGAKVSAAEGNSASTSVNSSQTTLGQTLVSGTVNAETTIVQVASGGVVHSALVQPGVPQGASVPAGSAQGVPAQVMEGALAAMVPVATEARFQKSITVGQAHVQASALAATQALSLSQLQQGQQLSPVTTPIPGTSASGLGQVASFTSPQGVTGLASATPNLVNSTAQASMLPKGSVFSQDLMQTLASAMVPTDAKTGEALDIPAQLLAQASHRAGQPNVTQWGPVTVNPHASLPQQAQALMTPLRDQLRFQIDQQIKKAEIRLDPPELGKLDLNIRLEGDRLQIQLHAANPSVRDALLSGLERLRADLSQDHGGMVDVDVSQGGSPESEQETRQTSHIALSGDDIVDEANESAALETNQLNILA